MMNPFRPGLRLKLTAALVCVAAVTAFFAGAFTILESYASLKRQKQQDELVIAKNIAAQVDEVLAKAKQTVESLSKDPDIVSMDVERQRRALTLVTKVTELIDGIFVLDPAGRLLVLDQAEPDTRRLLPERPYEELIVPVMSSGSARFSSVYRSRTGEAVVAIGAPIVNDGKVFAILSGGILLKNHTLGGIEEIRIGKTGYAYLVDEKGNVVVHPQRGRIFENKSTAPPVKELLQRKEGVLEFQNEVGVPVLAAYAPIRQLAWGVVVRQPTEESYAFADQIVYYLAGIFFLSLMFAIGIGVFLAWQITKPVTALVEGAQKVADGELDVSLPITSRDEFGSFAVTFNTMTRRLKAYLKSVEEAQKKALDAQSQLAQSEKLAAVGQLAAGLAHEINNPLNIISGFAEHLLAKTHEADARRPHIEDVHREAVRCQKLVSNLLDFAKPKEPALTETDIGALIDETLGLASSQLKKQSIETDLRIDFGLPRLRVDPDQMKQVFLNIVINACQAMPAGGTLTVDAKRSNGHIQVSVRDSGPGIPSEHLTKIFNPFFTTKEDGTGLGLPISYALVERHGGRLTAESALGQGATFTVAIPVNS